MFLPATSIITGVLITGLEAPTSLSSKAEPMPVTMRIKKDIIMPNNYTMDLRDCNLLGSAVGIWHLSVRTLGQPPYRVSTRKEKHST